MQSDFGQFHSQNKVTYNHRLGSEWNNYYAVVTRYACAKIAKSVTKSKATSLCVSGGNDASEHVVTNNETNVSCIVRDFATCSCFYFASQALPCKHVFAARTFAGLPLFCPELVPTRWLLSYQMHAPLPVGHTGASSQFTAVCYKQQCLSTRDKYKAAEKCALALADVLSCVGMSTFRRRLDLLEDLLSKWSNDVEVKLEDVDVDSDSVTEEQDVEPSEADIENAGACANDADVVTQHVDVDSDSVTEEQDVEPSGHSVDEYVQVHSAVELLRDEDREEADMENAGACANDADVVTQHVEVSRDGELVRNDNGDEEDMENAGGCEDEEVERGQAAAVADEQEISSNTAMHRVKVVRLDSMAPEGVCSAVQYPPNRKVRGRPKGTGKSLNRVYKGVKGNVQKKSTRTVDNCVECGLHDPPVTPGRRKKRPHAVDWVQCDQCDFWYHMHCTSLVIPPADGVPYACIRCS